MSIYFKGEGVSGKKCPSCNRMRKVKRRITNIGIADIWYDYCEKCNSFIDGDISNIKNFEFDINVLPEEIK